MPADPTFTNRLGIRSSMPLHHKVPAHARVTPVSPKALRSVSTSKKKLVIGSTWTLGKVNATLDGAVCEPKVPRNDDKPTLKAIQTSFPSEVPIGPSPAAPASPSRVSPLSPTKQTEKVKIDRSKWKRLPVNASETNGTPRNKRLRYLTDETSDAVKSEPKCPQQSSKAFLEARITDGPARTTSASPTLVNTPSPDKVTPSSGPSFLVDSANLR